MEPQDYPFEIRPLTADEGGGYLCTFPDLPGCMGDGETPEEALADGMSAAVGWLELTEEMGNPIPKPGSNKPSGKIALRVPKSMHTRLTSRAKQEGVSVNTLMVAILSEGLGARDAAHK